MMKRKAVMIANDYKYYCNAKNFQKEKKPGLILHVSRENACYSRI